ncbi:hypothetical protein TNIN_438901 [Trichonephila inaurata madagascariensis]|uniref:Uncharacterized protein n=1 Tax=Trichonephila inaurata madagascariensis TaxID=2747483 RepID=A0A8X6XZK6_9ARAC|nr:hypothetical protein TNIN_438901 [Trichonephila inaurata madagascariensis]
MMRVCKGHPISARSIRRNPFIEGRSAKSWNWENQSAVALHLLENSVVRGIQLVGWLPLVLRKTSSFYSHSYYRPSEQSQGSLATTASVSHPYEMSPSAWSLHRLKLEWCVDGTG